MPPQKRAALAFLASTLLLAACSGGSEDGYTAQFEAAFVATCVDAEGSPGEAACGCWYDGVQDQIPFEELPELDRLVSGGEEDLPEEPYTILARCSVNAAPAPTVPTTTTQPPPSTSTTAAP